MCNIHFLHRVPIFCLPQCLCLFVVYFCLILLGWTISISSWGSWLKCLCCRWWRLGRQKTLKTSGIWKSNRRLKSNQRTRANRGLGQKVQWKLMNEKKWKHTQMWKSIVLPQRKLACERSKHTTQFRPSRGKWHCLISNMADLWCWTKQVNMKFKTINCTSGTARVLTNHPNKRSFSPKLNRRRFLPLQLLTFNQQ